MNLNLKRILREHHRLTQTPNRVQNIKKDRVPAKLESEPAIYLINDLLFGHKVLHNFTISPKLARVRHESLPGNTRVDALNKRALGTYHVQSSGSVLSWRQDRPGPTGFQGTDLLKRSKTTEQSSHIPLGSTGRQAHAASSRIP